MENEQQENVERIEQKLQEVINEEKRQTLIAQYHTELGDTRMLVDRKLLADLYYFTIMGDGEHMVKNVYILMRSLTCQQRGDLVKQMVREIQANGGVQDMELVTSLKDSVYNPSAYFY